MNRILNAPRFHHRIHLYILRRLIIFANILSLSLYVFLHIIFYDLPFVPQDELLIILKILGLATGTAVMISFILFAGDALRYFMRHRKQFRFPTILHVPEPSPTGNNGA